MCDAAGRAAGTLVIGLRTGRFVAIRALATLLAMGGGPTMYRVIACSADKAADGIALAYRAGLSLRDMEMVQFHPTGLVIPGSLMTGRSEEHTSELQSQSNLVCRLLLEKKKQ